ncbi:fungal transcriptional regulatory protein [Scheffersomyces coipomensis]|uniref:fungal transcriptional regulatory protein n=1 Tax=Scheffersomyces coipomensis TaxID=1788519 RepID=UPI00315D3E7D
MTINVRACDNCKRGKRKCDKQSPCNTCMRYKRRCSYSEKSAEYQSYHNNHSSVEVSPDTSENHNDRSKRTKTDNFRDEGDSDSAVHLINIYKDYCQEYVKPNTDRNSFGPFSYVALQSDACLKHVWHYIDNVGMKYVIRPQKIPSYEMLAPTSTSPIAQTNTNTSGFDSTSHQRLTGIVLFNETQIGGEDAINLSETGLLKLLPSRKTLWLLVRRFFSKVYPFIPIIDERDFRTRISKLLDEESFEHIPFSSITLDNKYDFTYIGILLIILRLSYLSYFSNDLNSNNPVFINDQSSKSLELKFVLENPITLQNIIIAQKCLDEFNIFERTNVKVLQLAILLRTYRHLAPEEGDGPDGGDSQVLTSTLVNMATNLGINREPKSLDKRDKNLFRKLAIHLRNLDSSEFLCYGTPRSINNRYFDIQCPFHESNSSNLIDTDLEYEVIEAYDVIGLKFKLLSDLYDLIIDLNKSTSINLITEKLNFLNKNLLPDLKHSNSLSQVANVCQTKSSLLGLQFIMSVQYIIFMHYESYGLFSLSFTYIYDILKLIVLHVLPFIKTVNAKFENSDLMIVIPIIQTLYLKSMLMLCAVLIRTNISIQNEEKSSERIKYLILLSVSLRNCCIELLKAFANVSTRYYYFWRTNCGSNGVLKICFTKEFYEPIKNDSHCQLNYSTDQVQKFLNVFYSSQNSDEADIDSQNGSISALQNIDVNSVIGAAIPDISNDYISDTNLNSFWFYIKKSARTNATMKKFPNSSIDLSPMNFSFEEPFNLDQINQIYNEFYSELFTTDV